MTLVPQKPKTSTIHHRKRVGAHHKQSKHYKKTYWPYLPLLLVAGIGLFASSAWSGMAHGVLGANSSITSSNLLADTNTERHEFGKQSLQLSSQLTQAAQAKADDMAARDYWAHATPDGKQPWSFIASTGYRYKMAGENLAYGFSSADATVQGWMNSPEHRTNLLNTGFSQVGFGVTTTPDYQGHGRQTIVVAMYARPAAVVSLASANVADKAGSFSSTNMPNQEIARVQVLASSQPWALLFVIAVAAFGAGMFVLRHAIFWHRVLAKSEAFVVKHRMLDVIFVSVAVLGIILTRTAGFIH
jgi:uncharacterized protein YkwD